MGFLNGRVTAQRFRVDGPPPRLFTDEHLERLDHFRAGRDRIASIDGIECGWTAGGHILDTAFEPEKNIVNDALLFELRIDTDKLPSDLLKAYIEVELKAIVAENPSGRPSPRQKKEAREAAKERLEQEAKGGRFKKRKCVPVMWDGITNTVLFGATSITHIDRLVSLFEQTFGYKLDPITAGNSAAGTLALNPDAAPAAFVPGNSPDIAWIANDSNRDWLGNEFLLWLWFTSDEIGEVLDLPDGSTITYMLARSMSVECPSGRTGTDGFKHEGPSRLPEAKRAIQSGKLPRRCGITIVHHDNQFELTLNAETLSIASAKLPPLPDDVVEDHARRHERITLVRDLITAVEKLYAAFIADRFGPIWQRETLPSMQRWLAAN